MMHQHFFRYLLLKVKFPTLPITLSLEDDCLNAYDGWFVTCGSPNQRKYESTTISATEL